mgnify:CR=1 FL=1
MDISSGILEISREIRILRLRPLGQALKKILKKISSGILQIIKEIRILRLGPLGQALRKTTKEISNGTP